MQTLAELLLSWTKNHGWLWFEQKVHISFLSRLPTTYNHGRGGYGSFPTGEGLVSQVTDSAMCQKPQCLKGYKKPAWLCYFHMVSLHLGQPHIRRSGPFWPFRSRAQNQRVTLRWPSATPSVRMKRANFDFTPSSSRGISLAWHLAIRHCKTFFPGHWTWQWIQEPPHRPPSLLQISFSIIFICLDHSIPIQWRQKPGSNWRQLLLLPKILAAGLWGGIFPLIGKDKT